MGRRLDGLRRRDYNRRSNGHSILDPVRIIWDRKLRNLDGWCWVRWYFGFIRWLNGGRLNIDDASYYFGVFFGHGHLPLGIPRWEFLLFGGPDNLPQICTFTQ